MNEPKTMAEVIARVKAARQQLEQAAAGLSEAQMTATVVYGGRTPKDILAHIAFWDRRIIHAVKPEGGADAFRLAPPVIADIPYSDQWTHTVNERIYQMNRQKPLAEIKAEFEQAYRDLIAVLEPLSDHEAFDPNGLTALVGIPFEALLHDAYQHYEEHAAELARLRGGISHRGRRQGT